MTPVTRQQCDVVARAIALTLGLAFGARARADLPPYSLQYLGPAFSVSGMNNTGRIIGAVLGTDVQAWVWSAHRLDLGEWG